MFMKRISALFTNARARSTQDAWLAQSSSIEDLERRQREILRARFCGW
ncbi:DUF3563 family protein [Zhengella sp. ZM62]